MAFADTYRGKRVLLTGHTGFKGSWLAEWLLSLGAEVTGLALPPPGEPAIFDQLCLARRLHHRIGDIRDLATVRTAVEAARADFVFHLAAQPLVRLSYEQPVETYATNVLGTVHVLEAVRLARRPCSVVAITTDKSYENKEWVHSYREEDPMGGHDPYSSSKGMAELAIAAYRRSYFSAADSPVRLASARAGNVIGGGDWARDRIVPDCIRSLQRGDEGADMTAWEKTLKTDPANFGALFGLGLKMYELNYHQDARPLLERARRNDKGPLRDRKRIRMMLARIIEGESSFTDSETMLREGLALPPEADTDPRLQFLLSRCLATLGRTSEAKSELKKLIAAGYSLDSVLAFDMFPQTHHVETVSHLRRVNKL